MNVLMLSSSKYGNHQYLAYAYEWISRHLSDCENIVFIPYAGVSISWDAYTQKVKDAFADHPLLKAKKVTGIHEYEDPKLAIKQADAIIVGGGNTFNLVHHLYANQLVQLIQHKVETNTPYIGWSAGANICGLSLSTTNDMPIIEPESFTTLAFIQAQINPHYTDYVAPDHHGETRDQRIQEFCTLHPSTPVLAIPEGSALLLQDNKLCLLGDLSAVVFQGDNKITITADNNLTEYS